MKKYGIGRLFAVSLVFLCVDYSYASEKIAAANACTACHAQDKKLIGPSFDAIYEKYKYDALAVSKVVANIKSGGSGKWGAIPMPAQSLLKNEELLSLAHWILRKDKVNDQAKPLPMGAETMPGSPVSTSPSSELGFVKNGNPTETGSNNADVNAPSLEVAKKKCEELGFKKGTESFGKCVLTVSR